MKDIAQIHIDLSEFINRELTYHELIMLALLREVCDKDNKCEISNISLANYLNIHPNRVSTLLISMLYKGYINIDCDKQDKRIRIIELIRSN